jgi:hypothetical protein
MATVSVVLVSSVRGDVERNPAPSRIVAFEVARAMLATCIEREQEHQWFHGEVVSVRIEEDIG